MSGRSIKYLPLYLALFVFLLQLPDVGADPGTVFAVAVLEVIFMFIPPLLKFVSSESSVVLHPIS